MLDDGINRHATYTTTCGRGKAATETPAFQFSVLTCAARNQLATKIIYADGKEKPYDNAKWFFFKYCEIDCLEDFAKLVLTWLANESKRFIVRGQLRPGLDPAVKHRRLLYPKDNDPATIECPPRRWIPLDLDGVKVPAGLGAPDKLAEAAYHIRDNLLPSYFRGVRCVASATSSTGRKGLCTARLRLFFVLNEAADNDVLRLWVDGLSQKFIAIDPSVMLAMQPIYCARPWFHGCTDPVPEWGRVALLDGYEDVVVPELPRVSRARSTNRRSVFLTFPIGLMRLWKPMLAFGVAPIPPATEISAKAGPLFSRYLICLMVSHPKGGGKSSPE